MEPEENKVIDWLVKRWRIHQRKLRSSSSSMAESEYSGYALEELGKVLRHFGVNPEKGK